VEFPLGYVHGVNEVLSSQVMAELEGKAAGDTISVDRLQQAVRPAGRVLGHHRPHRERARGVPRGRHQHRDGERAGQDEDVLVTRIDDKTLTIDGNNPLCGRQVVFELEILTVRDATEAEIAAGGKVESRPELSGVKAVPLQ
jgi:FKBP-type peptidyl-prolyl cis-trans isomerase SlyD